MIRRDERETTRRDEIKMEILAFGLRTPVKSIVNYNLFRRHIHSRYEKMKDKIIFADEKNTITTKSEFGLSNGCKACKKGTWVCMFVGLRCHARCRFCSRALLNTCKDEPEGYQLGMPFVELVEKITNQKVEVEGVAYSGGEPLLYLDNKVIPIASMLSDKKPDIYQWIYTAGKLLDHEKIKKLKDAGIKEVRLNLAATNFDRDVMDKMPLIKEIVGKVTVEVPSIPEVYEKLIEEKLIHTIIEHGVDQINLAELYVTQRKALHYIRNKDVYYSRTNLLSPTESRNLTVDIIKYAIENNLSLLANDCSNDAKYWQIKKGSRNKLKGGRLCQKKT